MAYASIQDLIDRFGLAEVKQLAPSTAPVGYDQARLEQVLDDASAELDSYLGARYPTPLDPVPGLVVKYCADLARETLDKNGRDSVLEAGKRARAWARDVAKGAATLGSTEGAGGETPQAASSGILVEAPERVFSDRRLQGFLS